MSEFHKCRLPQTDTSGLHKLPPNAPFYIRLRRKFRRLTIVNPKNFKCNVFFQNRSAIEAEQKRHIMSRYNYIIHPFSTLNVILEVTFLVLWLAKMIYYPILNNMMKNLLLDIVDSYAVSTVQNVLIITFFFVGYIDTYNKEVVVQHDSIVKRYLKTYFFFDTCSTRAFIAMLEMITSFTTYNPQDELMLATGYIDVPCLYVRIYSILGSLDNICQMMGISCRLRTCIGYLIKTYLFLHFFTCLIYLVPQLVYLKDWPEDSWLITATIQPDISPPLFRVYGECMLMTVCFFFGASSGKYRVSQFNEQVCLSIITFFGRIYTLFILADALRLFGIVGISEASYEKQLIQLREYMISNNLPSALRARMFKYYETKLQKHYFNEKEILDTLSDNLKAELFLFSARKLMQKSDVFKYLPNSEISTLVSMMRLETFAPGDIIFKADQNIDVIYFISSGSIAIMTKGGQELCHLEDGDVLGLCMSLLDKRSYSALVIETSELFLINVAELTQYLETFPRAAEYLRQVANERLVMYKKLEQSIKNQVDSCLEELRKGALLEKKRRRKMVGE